MYNMSILNGTLPVNPSRHLAQGQTIRLKDGLAGALCEQYESPEMIPRYTRSISLSDSLRFYKSPLWRMVYIDHGTPLRQYERNTKRSISKPSLITFSIRFILFWLPLLSVISSYRLILHSPHFIT